MLCYFLITVAIDVSANYGGVPVVIACLENRNVPIYKRMMIVIQRLELR